MQLLHTDTVQDTLSPLHFSCKSIFFQTIIPKWYDQQSRITGKQEVTLEKHIKCSNTGRQIPSFP